MYNKYFHSSAKQSFKSTKRTSSLSPVHLL